jgi:hypothetical protein
MTHPICHAALRVLFLLFVGVIAVICAVQVCYLAIVDTALRNDLFALVFGKPEHWGATG